MTTAVLPSRVPLNSNDTLASDTQSRYLAEWEIASYFDSTELRPIIQKLLEGDETYLDKMASLIKSRLSVEQINVLVNELAFVSLERPNTGHRQALPAYVALLQLIMPTLSVEYIGRNREFAKQYWADYLTAKKFLGKINNWDEAITGLVDACGKDLQRFLKLTRPIFVLAANHR